MRATSTGLLRSTPETSEWTTLRIAKADEHERTHIPHRPAACCAGRAARRRLTAPASNRRPNKSSVFSDASENDRNARRAAGTQGGTRGGGLQGVGDAVPSPPLRVLVGQERRIGLSPRFASPDLPLRGPRGGASLALVPADLQWAVPILVDLLKIAGRDLSYESRVFRETARHVCPSAGMLDGEKPIAVMPLGNRLEPVGETFMAITKNISGSGLAFASTRAVSTRYLAIEIPEGIQVVLQVLRCRTSRCFYEIAGRFVVRMLESRSDDRSQNPVTQKR